MYQQELALGAEHELLPAAVKPTQRYPFLPALERRGNYVYIKRTAAGLSRDDLSRKSGISRRTIEAIECYRVVPSVYVALALSRALACPVHRLFRYRQG
jgi:DNA-binding XRE family transcriptional regulator